MESSSSSLLIKNQQALNICLQKIEKLQLSIIELESVKNLLISLPDKTQHQIMVPFGGTGSGNPPLMFMPGNIVHTNEVLVFLGDKWFVERSAKQSIEILDRRISKTKAMIEKVMVEKSNYENWLSMLSSLSAGDQEFCDITEESSVESEEQWKKQHRRRVKEHKMKEAAARALQNQNHDDLMKRLDQLELEESGLSKTIKGTKNYDRTHKKDNLDDLKEIDNGAQISGSTFSGKVVDRGSPLGALREAELGDQPSALAPTANHDNDPTKKVSRFKMSRQTRGKM